ncbi:MAG: M48 family metallopeptidase [Alphaproteobacteria bacterium]|nr:M48 family metallopeptidase [Alphaproteobacteria bacterium]
MTAPTTNGFLNDGRTIDRRAVRIWIDGKLLRLAGEAGATLDPWPIADLVVVDIAGSGGEVRLTRRPDWAVRLTIRDKDLADTLFALRPDLRRGGRNVSRGGLMVAAGAAVVLGLLILALPRLSPIAVVLVPRSFEERLGHGTMAAVLDFFPNQGKLCTDVEGTAVLAGLVGDLSRAAGLESPPIVSVLESPVRNAFALPGGRIVLMSSLLFDMRGPDELGGVLAHEIGHVRERHGMQSVIEQIGLDAFLSLVFGGGGLGSVGEAGSGLLVGLAYSRRHEREADLIALDVLRAAGMRAGGLVAFFERMEGSDEGPTFLSSHPATAERKELFAQVADGGRRTLDDSAWNVVRRICAMKTAIEP